MLVLVVVVIGGFCVVYCLLVFDCEELFVIVDESFVMLLMFVMDLFDVSCV